jgi:hypothetical protein
MAGKKIDKGRSMLNATDDTANPYGLILSEVERDFIYGQLTRLDNMTNALLYGRTGRKQQVWATLSTAAEILGIGIATVVASYLSDIPKTPVFIIGVGLLVLQKLNLLLRPEKIDDTSARRTREDEEEAKKRAQYFKDMGAKDINLEK